MNTPKQGTYRWMIYKEGDSWIGVAMEFNIVVTGEDPRMEEIELNEAVIGYLESVKKIKGFRDGQINPILNQMTEQEYENLWTSATAKNQGAVPSPLSDIYKLGIGSLANV